MKIILAILMILFPMVCYGQSYQTVNSRSVPVTQYVTPTTGSTVNVNSTGNITLLINPAGTLVSLTIAFPSGPSSDDVVTIASTQAITGLTMSNGTVVGALTTMAIGTFAKYQFNSTAAEWFRIG